MLVKSIFIDLILYLTNMKVTQSTAIPAHLLAESTRIGQLLARLRIARKVKQTDAALRAGLISHVGQHGARFISAGTAGEQQAGELARCALVAGGVHIGDVLGDR